MIQTASPTDFLSPLSLVFPQRKPQARAKGGIGDDQRGAVMVTGLFMAAVLVGALWYVMGIGDAMIFRDRMQEAADHSAYTSAALHAKGMNFICAMNIIMLVLVAVHIVLGIIHDFALAVCILTGVGCPFWIGARRAYTGYEKLFKPAITGFHFLSLAAGYGYPWLGLWKGYQTGGKYGKQGRAGDLWVPALSPSMIPGFLSDATLGRPRAMRAKTGLPVVAKTQDYLCGKLAANIFDFAKKFANLPGLGTIGKVISKITCIFGCETVEDIIKKLGTAAIKFRYCNSLGSSPEGEEANDPSVKKAMKQLGRGTDMAKENDKEANDNRKEGDPIQDSMKDFPEGGGPSKSLGAKPSWNSIIDPGFDRGWGQDGPYTIAQGAENGKDAMMVWSLNIGPKYLETSEKKVKVASRQWHTNKEEGPDTAASLSLGPLSVKIPGIYYAQSEFYFDCEKKWGDDDCNKEDNAMFAIKWRARMHHLEMPNLGVFISDTIMDGIMNSKGYQETREKITNPKGFEDLNKTVLDSIGISIIRGEIGAILGKWEGLIRTGVNWAADKGGEYIMGPTVIPGSYH